ncbi:MAG: ATP-binding protein [Chryseolinea sp.]
MKAVATPDPLEEFKAFETTPGVNVIVLPDAPTFTLVAASNDFLSLTGLRKEDILHRGLFVCLPQNPNDGISTREQNIKGSFESVIKNKLSHELPSQRYDIRDSHGNFLLRYWKYKSFPLLDINGDVAYIVHNATNITDDAIAEKNFEGPKNLEKDYRFLTKAPVIIGYVRGEEYIIDFANEGLLEAWGRDKSVIGKPLFTAIPELEDQGTRGLLDHVRTTGKPFYAYGFPLLLNRSGRLETIYFDFVYQPFFQDEAEQIVSGVFSVGHDVTAQVLAKKEIESTEKKWKELADLMPAIVWRGDAEGKINFLNKRWYEFTGLSEDASINFGWTQVVHPDDIEASLAIWNESLSKGQFYQSELRYKHHDNSFRWMIARAIPIRQDGVITSWYGTSSDIQEHKQLELLLEESVRKRTLQLEKSLSDLKYAHANLEEFSYAASHDLSEPVRKFQFYSNRLKEELKHILDEKQIKFFTRLEQSANRMQNLIQNLLEYSHASKGSQIFEEIHLETLLSSVLEDLELIIRQKKAVISFENLPTLTGSIRQLQQLFQNLVSNALKYCKADVAPEINVVSSITTGKTCGKDLADDLTNRSFYLIKVSDNGIGFNQEDAEKIFKVFTRLHSSDTYSGSGIGLSIVWKVVESHNGFIWADSEPAVGSTFSILLPVSQQSENDPLQ